jgi:hypothetical protein
MDARWRSLLPLKGQRASGCGRSIRQRSRPLPGTEQAEGVFCSPDSRSLAFAVPGKLKRVEVATGAVKDLCEISNIRAAAWNRQGTIVFGVTSVIGIYGISADGGMPVLVTRPNLQRGESNHYPFAFLPDDKHFLYWIRSALPGVTGIYVGSLDTAPEKQDRKLILSGTAGARYTSVAGTSGYLIFQRARTLFAQPFDPDRLELKGMAKPIADNVGTGIVAGIGQMSASQNGVLTTSNADTGLTQLVLVARDGTTLATIEKPNFFQTLHLSRDGKRVALRRNVPEAATFDVSLMDLAGGMAQKSIDESDNPVYPVWSPDGKEIAFSSNREGPYAMYRKATDGRGGAHEFHVSDRPEFIQQWSKDGKSIIYIKVESDRKRTLWLLPLEPSANPVPLVSTDAYNYGATLSPSGHCLAFVSNRDGADNVYLQSFPSAGTTTRVSSTGGTNPQWSANDRELFYNTSDNQLVVAEVKPAECGVAAGPAKALFPLLAYSVFRGAR